MRQLLLHLILLPLVVSWLFPFLWMVGTSLKVDTQIMVWPPILIPHPVAWHNYVATVQYIPFFLYVRNTAIISLLAVVGILLSCPPVAYSFSRLRWPGRNALFIVTLATMMIPFQVTMIPVFIVFKTLGLVGSWAPLIVPSFFGGAFYIFLLRQFFMTVPRDLSDAARIDGAGELGIYLWIMLPLIRPAIAVIALFEFMARWRDFLGPLIYLDNEKLYTISLGLQQYSGEHHTEWALLMAASVLATLPIVVLFVFTQRTFIEGITFTGIKG